VNTKRTARQWKALAELMASRIRGDPAPADVAQVVGYLQRNLARPETADEAKATDPLRDSALVIETPLPGLEESTANVRVGGGGGTT